MVKHLITKPITFVGMMGSGKSTIGRKVAHKLHLQFYDSDKVVEEEVGLSVADIYEFKGVEFFQQKESDVVKEILDYGIVVLATGGGTFLNPELHKLIKEKSISIWLSTDIDTLSERILRRNTRPEFNCENPVSVLEEMIKEKNHLYEDADIIVESKNFDVHYVVDTLMAKLRKYLDQHG